MIIITGRIVTNAGNRSAIIEHCTAHCVRSRAEPGCLDHRVHFDCENPDQLVFVEKWADKASLAAHFGVAASGAFIRTVTALSEKTPEMEIYKADEITAQEIMA